MVKKYSTVVLRGDILFHARSLDIPEMFAVSISEAVAKAVEDFLGLHPVVTKNDIDTIVVSEMEKYHPDLAYIYANRDKII